MEGKPPEPKRVEWERESTMPSRNTPGDIEESTVNGIAFDVRRLIHATEKYPVTKQPFDAFLTKLDASCWVDSNNERVAPRTLADLILAMGYEGAIQAHPEYTKHIRKIERADYSFPIHVYQGTVVNGAHRLTKLFIETRTGKTTQNFITLKDLKTIPAEALTQRGLLRKKESSMQSEQMHGIDKITVFEAIRSTNGSIDDTTQNLVNAWLQEQEVALMSPDVRMRAQTDQDIAEVYLALHDIEAARDTLEDALLDVEDTERRGRDGDLSDIRNTLLQKISETHVPAMAQAA